MMNIEQLTQDAIDGTENPFKALAKLKALEAKVKECIKQVQPIAIDEAEKYDKKFEYQGLSIERREGKRMFNFKEIKEWNTYNKALKDCEERYKLVYQNFSKGLQSITSDGELLEMPVVTYAKPSLIIKQINE